MRDSGQASIASRLLASRALGDFSPDFLEGSLTLPQALDLQLAVLYEQRAAGHHVAGWKVGLTSEASRQKLGADERPFGFVLDHRSFDSGTTIDSSQVTSMSIETEMCFTIGRTVDDPDVTPDAVLDYVSGVSAGFELTESRPGSVRPDFFAFVADGLMNWGIVSGVPVPPADAATLSDTAITMERNGEQVFAGISHEHVDDHTISLCRLVEQLDRHGQRLQAGERVITGAFARFPAAPGEHWRASYEGIGTVEIDIV